MTPPGQAARPPLRQPCARYRRASLLEWPTCGIPRRTAATTDAMRLYLQTMPASAEAPRYVQIVLEQDLLGGWTLYRESGTQGGKATLKREQFLERDEAFAAFEKARDTQLKRGYRLMFSQGLDGPHGR
jgi:predicted DNA-binding WGR domain protein